MTIGVKKNQDSDHITVSKAVQETMQTLKAQDPSLEYVVVNDYSDQISNSLNSVFQTMIMAVIVAMLIIWLFFGDIKASPDRRNFHPGINFSGPHPHESHRLYAKRHHPVESGSRRRNDGR